MSFLYYWNKIPPLQDIIKNFKANILENLTVNKIQQ